eukprot:12236708-Alexandrium_andersonii.AAC.1
MSVGQDNGKATRAVEVSRHATRGHSPSGNCGSRQTTGHLGQRNMSGAATDRHRPMLTAGGLWSKQHAPRRRATPCAG